MADGADLDVKGNIVNHEYTVEDGRSTVAEVSKKWFRVADTYGVEVAPGQDPALMLAITAVLDTMAHEALTLGPGEAPARRAQARTEDRWTLACGELGFYAAYFQANRNAARLWLDGRVSPTVRAKVLRYNRRTAQRLHGVAITAGLATPQTDPLVFVVLVELGDRVLDLAFRERREPDPDVIGQGRIALIAYLATALRL